MSADVQHQAHETARGRNTSGEPCFKDPVCEGFIRSESVRFCDFDTKGQPQPGHITDRLMTFLQCLELPQKVRTGFHLLLLVMLLLNPQEGRERRRGPERI